MAVVVRMGVGYVADSPVSQQHVTENPGDAMVFPDVGTANAFLTARGFPAQAESVSGISGQRNRGKRSNND